MRTRELIPDGLVTGLRRALLICAMALVAFMGGVAATQLWPVQTQTQYFSAEVSVEPNLRSTVHLPTVVGDVVIDFDGPIPAPGLTAQVQVRDEVTDLLRSGRLQTTDLQPDRAELRAAIDDGVREVAWKFALGASVTTLLALLAYAVARPRRTGHVLLVSGVATALALAGPGAAAYLTYRTSNVAEFRATSLLSLVQANQGILDDLDRKADQGAVYVTNLLALSDAVRREFNPDAADNPAAARFLLVSDIHGLNQFPLMRQIVATEDIDAVIDTGDLVNFGQPREGDLTGIYDGIESLGVPYVFVRGNHDATSATDEGLLRRLAQVPNVLLLEPTAGDFRRVEINGVSISGFNDTRYFNQSGADFADEQVGLAQAFRDATAEQEPTDLVVTHQPYSAHRVKARAITLNGHMHVPRIEREHLQLGSFTGGGLFNGFRLPQISEGAREAAEEDPATAGELAGHPFSFDVLTVGEDCSLTSLTRYSYRNLVTGRPQYDDVSIINGRTLQATPPQEDRVCSRDLGTTTSPLAVVGEGDEGDDVGDGDSGDEARSTGP